MTEAELDSVQEVAAQRPFHFEWLLPMVYRPRATLQKIAEQPKAVWLTPLLLLSLLAIILVLVGGPIRKMSAQGDVMIPESFQYMTPEEQAQLMEGLQANQGPMFVYGFPALGALAGVWVRWFLLASILHLALTLAGSRGNSVTSFNLAGWAAVPLVVRYIVQILYVLFAHRLVAGEGLSGFIAADAAGFAAFMRVLLAQVDIYLIWMAVLLVIGAAIASHLPKTKAIAAVVSTIVILLLLVALPAFLLGKLSGLNMGGYMFF